LSLRIIRNPAFSVKSRHYMQPPSRRVRSPNGPLSPCGSRTPGVGDPPMDRSGTGPYIMSNTPSTSEALSPHAPAGPNPVGSVPRTDRSPRADQPPPMSGTHPRTGRGPVPTSCPTLQAHPGSLPTCPGRPKPRRVRSPNGPLPPCGSATPDVGDPPTGRSGTGPYIMCNTPGTSGLAPHMPRPAQTP